MTTSAEKMHHKGERQMKPIELYDQLAVAMMATRPDLKQMSLDEWLYENFDDLSDAEVRAASAIVDLHMGVSYENRRQ